MSFHSIPSFSFDSIKQSDPKTIKDLTGALSNHGFFTITDHGVPEQLLTDGYNKSKEFFNLPFDKKNQYAHPEIAGARGYTPFGKETALGENVPDLKEFWHHGPQVNESFDSRIASNIKVNEVTDFNKDFDKLFLALHDLGMEVLKAIALILDRDQNFFTPWVQNGNSVLRLIHYPPVEDKSNSLRARAHEDINLITLLVGAEESGLEVQNSKGEWIPIEAESKSIVCNIGDMMQLVTRNKLKSTTHRVVDYNSLQPKSRYSMPFFLHPSPQIELCSIVDNSPESISAHDFLEERLRAIKLY